MDAGVATATGAVAIKNEAEVAPLRIFTVAGGTTAAALLTSETATPPLGAGPVSVMVADTLLPPVTLVPAKANVDITGEFTVSCADTPALL
jgi:hypothetical protein